MQWKGDPPFHGHLVSGRALCGLDPSIRNAVRACLPRNFGIIGIEEERELRFVKLLRILYACRVFDAIRVVEQHPEIADAPDTSFRTNRGLPGLDARIAEDALFRLAGGPVIINLFVRTSRYA